MLNQPDHQGLLPRQAFSHQEGQGHQGIVVDKLFYWSCQQCPVTAQVPQEQKRATALIAVGQWVIFDDEVKQMGGSGSDIGIEKLISETLLDGSQCRGEAIPT